MPPTVTTALLIAVQCISKICIKEEKSYGEGDDISMAQLNLMRGDAGDKINDHNAFSKSGELVILQSVRYL